jgi:hypothetical protein
MTKVSTLSYVALAAVYTFGLMVAVNTMFTQIL